MPGLFHDLRDFTVKEGQGMSTTMVPLPASPDILLSAAQRFPTKNPVTYCLKQSELFLNVAHAGFQGLLTCKENRTI